MNRVPTTWVSYAGSWRKRKRLAFACLGIYTKYGYISQRGLPHLASQSTEHLIPRKCYPVSSRTYRPLYTTQQLSVQPKEPPPLIFPPTNRPTGFTPTVPCFPVYDRHRPSHIPYQPYRPYNHHHHHEPPSLPCRRPRRRPLRLPSHRCRRPAPSLLQQQRLGTRRLERRLPPCPEHGHYVSSHHLCSSARAPGS